LDRFNRQNLKKFKIQLTKLKGLLLSWAKCNKLRIFGQVFLNVVYISTLPCCVPLSRPDCGVGEALEQPSFTAREDHPWHDCLPDHPSVGGVDESSVGGHLTAFNAPAA